HAHGGRGGASPRHLSSTRVRPRPPGRDRVAPARPSDRHPRARGRRAARRRGVRVGMTSLRVDHRAAELRRAIGPVAWFVLDELLLGDGEEAGAAFIARASARRVAAAVSLNKDTVARAFTALAHAGVIELVPQSNAGGRFASGRYRVAVLPGITRLD